MALIRGAFGGGQIKGSISGMTYQGSPFGQMMRNRTVPVNPNTSGQVSTRLAMAYCSNYWSSIMTQPQLDSWADYAAGTPLPDKFGTSHYVSGRAMFMRTNVNLYLAGVPVLPVAPILPGIAVDSIPQLTIVASAGIKVTGLTIDPIGGGTFQISLSPPLGLANKFFKGPFRTGTIITDSADLPVTIRPSAQCAVGQFYFMRFRNTTPEGKVSKATMLKFGPLT